MLSKLLGNLFGKAASPLEQAEPFSPEGIVPKTLIIGLGNPGKKYDRTRHNIGFRIVDRLAEREGAKFAPHAKWRALVAKTEDALLVKPLTFMNESGRAVRAIADFFKIAPEDCLIVFDDFSLPFGQLRIKRQGSAGGHNGIKSMISSLGTAEFPRIKFGIGDAGSGQATGHVLGKFSRNEEAELPVLIEDSADAVRCVVDRGIEAAMAEWNSKKR